MAEREWNKSKVWDGAYKAWHEAVGKEIDGRSCFQKGEVRKEECSWTGGEAEVRSSSSKPWGACGDWKHPFPVC